MGAPFDRRIVVDGNDGTGKSTLARTLRQLGFANVEDRAELTKATDDDGVGPAEDTIYLLLTCAWQTSLARLQASGADMSDRYHQPAALEHYDARFRALASRFEALVLDTEGSQPADTLAAALRALCRGPLRVGLPKGRLPASSIAELLGPLASWCAAPRGERTLFWEQGPLLLLQTRTKAYPKLVAFGELDLALCGSDVLAASPFAPQVEVLARVEQPGVRLVLAAPGGTLPAKPLLRVATEQRDIAQRYLAQRGIPHTIFELSGATEGFVPLFADAIVDITETGRSLRDNGLDVVDELGPLFTCLIRRGLA